ncbi:type IV secretion system DNA-binding domain-containing protein [Achromobacter ruhlandii]|uniref:type IV secretion system DNA-binding domain-containing protein n=1 Tax=Achromobacter ruhlandii TaxID=72557 RepID=UPI003BA0DA25
MILLVLLPGFFWIQSVKRIEQPAKMGLAVIFQLARETPQKPHLWGAALVGLLLAAMIIWLMHKAAKTEFGGAPFRRFFRGTKIVSQAKLARMTKQRGVDQIRLAGVPIPPKLEPLHNLIVGSTGAGKTVTFKEVTYWALKRGDRALIVDPNAELYSIFGRPGDTLLNPFDSRSPGWQYFNEIRTDYDHERYAMSVVGSGNSREQEEWYAYGRLLVAETGRKLQLLGRPSIRDLHRMTTLVPPEELHKFLQGTAAESLFTGADRALASARFLLSTKLAPHLKTPVGDFSIRRWLEEEKEGNLFITWREDQHVALRPLISAWTDIFATSVLSLPPSQDRRLWMMLDELASHDKLPSLEAAVTKGRKHGLRVVAGLQTVAQAEEIYGVKQAQTLLATFRNVLVLGGTRVDEQTNKVLSGALGAHEVERERYGMNSAPGAQSVSSSLDGPREEKLVMPSQVGGMAELEGYLALAQHWPVAKVKLKPVDYKVVNQPFVSVEI